MITVVAGLGRCGTSMIMQMLAAGGADVVGRYPAFEVDEAARVPVSNDWLASLDGRVVKILDPQRGWRYSGAARVIWMDRDPKEQARSMRKFLSTLAGISPKASALASTLRSDRKRALGILSNCDRMIFSFESILTDPLREASRLLTFFPALNVQSAAGIVQRRSAACAPDMALELSQIS